MRIKRVERSQYYTAIYTTGKPNSKGLPIGILRNDTFELTCTWRVQQTSICELKSMLDKLEPPEDWRQPYRKCLAYHVSKKERMERLIYPAYPKNLFKLIKRQEAFTYYTLKKLCALDSSQIYKLLSLSASEKGDTSVDCLSLIHGRISLYNMIFDKKESHVRKFRQMVSEAAELHPDYSFSQII